MEGKTISAQAFINSLKAFCLLNKGDIATEELLLSVGADVMNVTYDEMEKLLNES